MKTEENIPHFDAITGWNFCQLSIMFTIAT